MITAARCVRPPRPIAPILLPFYLASRVGGVVGNAGVTIVEAGSRRGESST